MGRRFFGYGELPLVILALLDERQMHGYELMSELERLFGPHYRPSPGSVYPAMDALETEGLVVPHEHAGARVFRLTAEGRKALNKRRPALAAIELRTGVRIGQNRAVDAALERFALQVRRLAGRIAPDELEELLGAAIDQIQARSTSNATKEV